MSAFFGVMLKGNKYVAVKILIEAGHIKTFAEIFHFIPPTTVNLKFGVHYGRFKNLIANPGELKLKEVYLLASYFGVDKLKMLELVYNQHKKTPEKE